MGVKIKDLVVPQAITFDHLTGKVLAVDAYNILYQFLTTIRQPDGSPLVDGQGKVTSHLNGLFYRTTKLMEKGLKLVFVFDGKAPALKQQEIARRMEHKQEARLLHEKAVEAGDVEAMKKYASRISVLSKEMVAEAQELLSALGIPFVCAPGEGEAQAAHMAKKGDAFAVASQDFDSLLFGAPRVVRNLSIEGRRKLAGKLQYSVVEPEMITIQDALQALGINQEQLIVLGMLVGTDYNIGGIPGIGPKNALKWVKKEKDFGRLFEQVKWSEHFSVPWQDVFAAFTQVLVTDDYSIVWKTPQPAKVHALLVEGHSFGAERVEQRMQKLVKETEQQKQTGLGKWC